MVHQNHRSVRSRQQQHLVVERELHFVVRQYAAKNNLTIAEAATRLIKQGLVYATLRLDSKTSEYKLKVRQIVDKELKSIRNSCPNTNRHSD